MALELTQIKEILKEPVSKKKIAKAKLHEQRIKLHVEASLSQADTSQAITELLDWVKKLIPADKYFTFVSLLRFPLRTVELTGQIFQALEKVFDGRNPVYSYDFTSPDAAGDWDEYRSQALNEPHVWREKGFEAMKTAINSVLIVDVPVEQEGSRPDPYFYWLDINRVVDFLCVDENQLEWIMFNEGEDRLAVFDDVHYRLFEKKDDGEIGNLLYESQHELGYCPARFFWSTPINTKDKEVKKNPISDQLGEIDTFFFKDTSFKHLETYAAYPIYWTFAQDCDYEYNQEQTGHREYCDGGFLRDNSGHYIMQGNSIAACPKCSAKKLSGAGSLIEVEPPGLVNDKADLREPVGIVEVSRDSLDYNKESLRDKWQDIYTAVTGYGGEPNNDQAVNEKQIIAAFESRKQVLLYIKDQFEKAQAWVDKTICKLRYGDLFISCSIDYGNEFYLYTPEQILEWYNEARKEGVSDVVLDMLQKQYYETKYRNNPEMLYRHKVLVNLDPLRHIDRKEALEMHQSGLIAYDTYFLKANFSTLIQQFERQNIPVQQFGEALAFDKKIERINETLLSYIVQPEGQNQSVEDLGEIFNSYGVGVRAGAITPQIEDEQLFRIKLGLPAVGNEVKEAWNEDGGIRRPITVKSQLEKEIEIENLED